MPFKWKIIGYATNKLLNCFLFDDIGQFHEESSDDNFSLVEKHIPDKIDLIYIDSFHDADHVKKIFYHYYRKYIKLKFFSVHKSSQLSY